jgi:hypothetical protein
VADLYAVKGASADHATRTTIRSIDLARIELVRFGPAVRLCVNTFLPSKTQPLDVLEQKKSLSPDIFNF